VLRIADFTLALIGLVITLPVMLLAMLAVRLDSRGPALFAQTRVGRNLEPFTCYKLRTMAVGTRDGASHLVGKASITRVGGFLRRTKLDELPQLWNVLVGEMSLVGPRPCLPSQLELIAERRDQGVIAMRPGITGPAQVAGLDMSTPRELARADAQWKDGTLRDYLAILVATVAGGGRGDAAIKS
jgi:O-antigen biosynthesis protein WbqP